MGFLDSVRNFLDKQEDKIERQQVLEAAAEEATPERLQESTLSKNVAMACCSSTMTLTAKAHSTHNHTQ